MHYDHCGNGALFPNARFHMQDTEMEYVTGRCMCHHQINHAFEPEDVSRMVYRVFAGHVQFHDGVDEVAPGITVHKIGGHTKGLQCVRVPTARGHVVLASDATHFYQHIDTRRVFRVLYNLADMVEGYNTLERLASSKAHVIPGHDPLVLDALSGGIQVDCGVDSALGPGTARELTQNCAQRALLFYRATIEPHVATADRLRRAHPIRATRHIARGQGFP